MKLALLSIFSFGLLFYANAHALEVEAAVGVYYFTSNQEKIAGAQNEIAEAGQLFPANRDPYDMARDFAREELAKGNVCLKQAERDLRSAQRSKLISRMCREIFHDDIASAQASARQNKWKADSLRCEASVEAREASGKMKVALSFRSRLMMSERLPEKLAKAGFGEEPKGWVLPPREIGVGESSEGWKGILKNRSCSLDDDALNEHLDTFLKEAKEARMLVICRQRLNVGIEGLSRLQAQLKQYVPGEWLADVGGSSAAALLEPMAGAGPTMSMSACRASRDLADERLEDLRHLAESVASKHDIPALKDLN